MESGLRIAGRYRLERALGGGGFGQVWRATDILRDWSVAVKFLHRDVAASGPLWLSKFRQEARIAARLSHPNIAAVDDFGEYDGQWYLVMEFLQGRDLAEEIAAHPDGSRCSGRWCWPRRSRTVWPLPMSTASCTGTSSRRT